MSQCYQHTTPNSQCQMCQTWVQLEREKRKINLEKEGLKLDQELLRTEQKLLKRQQQKLQQVQPQHLVVTAATPKDAVTQEQVEKHEALLAEQQANHDQMITILTNELTLVQLCMQTAQTKSQEQMELERHRRKKEIVQKDSTIASLDSKLETATAGHLVQCAAWQREKDEWSIKERNLLTRIEENETALQHQRDERQEEQTWWEQEIEQNAIQQAREPRTPALQRIEEQLKHKTSLKNLQFHLEQLQGQHKQEKSQTIHESKATFELQEMCQSLDDQQRRVLEQGIFLEQKAKRIESELGELLLISPPPLPPILLPINHPACDAKASINTDDAVTMITAAASNEPSNDSNDLIALQHQLNHMEAQQKTILQSQGIQTKELLEIIDQVGARQHQVYGDDDIDVSCIEAKVAKSRVQMVASELKCIDTYSGDNERSVSININDNDRDNDNDGYRKNGNGNAATSHSGNDIRAIREDRQTTATTHNIEQQIANNNEPSVLVPGGQHILPYPPTIAAATTPEKVMVHLIGNSRSAIPTARKNRHVTNFVYVNPHTGITGQYTGYLCDGRPNERGMWRSVTGDMYEGEFLNGTYQGHGVYTSADGDLYTGSFVTGKRHGNGAIMYSNGNIYDGEFMDGVRHGTGTLTKSAGGKYEGSWLNNKQHGSGVSEYPDGWTHIGEYQDDRPMSEGRTGNCAYVFVHIYVMVKGFKPGKTGK